MLHEDSVCYRVQAFWNQLFFSKVPEATTLNRIEVAPIDISIVGEFRLRSVLSLVEIHVDDEGNCSTLSAQLSELLHFVLTTEELIVINGWQIFLKCDHLVSKFKNLLFIHLDIIIDILKDFGLLWSSEITFGLLFILVKLSDLIIEHINFFSDLIMIELLILSVHWLGNFSKY